MRRSERIRRMWGLVLLTGLALPANASGQDGYDQVNLIASRSIYNPRFVDKTLLNAWGIALRPAGFGGHFWVTSNGNGTSDQYQGDVGDEIISIDPLHLVRIPGPVGAGPAPLGTGAGTPTGVVFNPGDDFVLTQLTSGGRVTAPARFIFVGDDGVLSAWTERDNGDGTFDRPGYASRMADLSGRGSALFGLAISGNLDRLYAADFGASPGILVFNRRFREITAFFRLAGRFENPFDAEDGVPGLQPGDYAPFNVQAIGDSLFIAFARTQEDPEHPGQFFAGEEDAAPGQGRLAEYDFDGELIAAWDDAGLLNAPWGIAKAPADFGEFSGALLVSNFGDGTLTAFDPLTRRAIDVVRDPDGQPVVIEGIWGITFGNGASLGESNHLYFAAGPADEEDGLFGKLVPLRE